MALTNHYLEVAFGPGYTGLGTVGYALKSNTGAIVVARTTTGVFAVADGTYGVVVPTVANTVATIEWDTGGGTPLYAHEDMLPALRREAIYTGVTAIDGRLPSDPADESLQQAAHGVTQSAIAALNNLSQAGVQSALTAQGLTTTRAGYLDRLDAAITTRAAPGAAMDLVTDAVDAAALAADAVTEIRDGILDDATRFHGASIAAILADTAAMDARLPSDPADESLQQASHTATQAAITALNNLSQAGVQSALTAQGLTTTRAGYLDQLDAAVSSRSTLTGGQAADAVWDEALAGHLGAGTTGKALSDAGAGGDPGAIADAVWDEALSGHVAPGTAGEAEGRLDVGVSTRAAPGDAMTLSTGAVTAAAMTTGAADVVRDRILSDSTAFQGARIDAAVSSRAAPGAAMALTPTAQAAVAVATTDDVWDEALASHLTPGTMGKALQDAGATSDPSVIAAAVWDKTLASHLTPGSTGKGLDEARTSGAAAQQIADAPTVWPPVAGSLLDRLTNADVSQTYDASTDSLEAIRNRIG